MRMAMATRTKVTLVVGFIVFVGGSAGAAYLGTRGRDAGSSSDDGRVAVVYAARPVPAGVAGTTALAEGLVTTRKVLPSAAPPDALTDASLLTGRVAVASIPAGTIVTTGMFPEAQTRIGTVVIPPGKRALALQLGAVSGVAGFAGAGDRVDVYSVTTADTDGSPPGVRLILQGVEVLNVNGTGLPSAQGQSGAPDLVYLLAVTPAEAERLIYLTEFHKLYFDLVPKDEPPVATPGAGPGQALQVL